MASWHKHLQHDLVKMISLHFIVTDYYSCLLSLPGLTCFVVKFLDDRRIEGPRQGVEVPTAARKELDPGTSMDQRGS